MASTSQNLRALSRCFQSIRSPNVVSPFNPHNFSTAQTFVTKPLPPHAHLIVKDSSHGSSSQHVSLFPLMARKLENLKTGISNGAQQPMGLATVTSFEGFSVRALQLSRTTRQFHSWRPVEQLPVGITKQQIIGTKGTSNVLLWKSPSSGYSTSSWTERLQQQWKNAVKTIRPPKEVTPKVVKSPPVVVKAAASSGQAIAGKSGANTFLNNTKATAGRLASQYRKAAGLQAEAFWRRNYPIILACVAFLLVMLLWRIMYGVASTFISFSEGMAKYGFLALASSIVAFSGLYLKTRYTVNPDGVYRQTMRMLQINAKVLEVMGAPLSGSHVRAYVMSGGGLRFKNYKMGLSSRRCFLIFPVRGPEGRGLVSAEIKKKSGKYDFKLLAVDVATSGSDSGVPQRIYIIGNENEYVESGGVIAELRDPVVKALAKQKDFDAEDDREAEEEARHEKEEREKKAVEREQAAEREAAAERERRLEEARKK